MEEIYPCVNNHIISCIIGLDSLEAINSDKSTSFLEDIRLHLGGLFKQEEQAIQFTKDFTALYTNRPAAGGGIRSISYQLLYLYALNKSTACCGPILEFL